MEQIASDHSDAGAEQQTVNRSGLTQAAVSGIRDVRVNRKLGRVDGAPASVAGEASSPLISSRVGVAVMTSRAVGKGTFCLSADSFSA